LNKLIIIGKGRGWENAPYDAETWGITQLILQRPVDLVIDMNDYTLWGTKEAEEASLARSLAMMSCVRYIDRDNYELKEIINHFKTNYFTNTVDYALALAIYKGYKDIHLYGVNLELDGEYAYQKPGCEFWIGQAMGRGCDVHIHGEYSSLLKTQDGRLYGYGTPQVQNLWVS
jgi:hypothetical protein